MNALLQKPEGAKVLKVNYVSAPDGADNGMQKINIVN